MCKARLIPGFYISASVFVSIIIPSFKGATILRNNVPGLIAYFHSRGTEHEIIIVDDGSEDNGETKKVADQLGCRFLKNEQNMGKGAAVRKGMLAAAGRF